MELHAIQEMIDVGPTNWWYRVRRSIVKDLLEKYVTGSGAKPKLLDVGCGPGDTLFALKDRYEVQGVEIAPDAVEAGHRRGLTITIADLPKIPFPDATFDVVTMLDVLEHIEDEKTALSEVYRVLKPGGIFIIFVPAFMFLWSVNDVVSKHFRRYTRQELSRRVTEERFTILRSSYFNTFLFPPIMVTRFLIWLFKIPVKSEVALTVGPANSVLFSIFYLESLLLRFVNYPFGVSLLCVCRK